MEEVKVSIIIPLYNGAAEIGETLRALGRQTYRNFEVIVVDDGSKDNPATAIAAVGDARVTCVRQENQGPAAARNNGFARSTGGYVMFLDHDDILLPEAIKEAVDFLGAHPDYGVVYYDFLYCTPGDPPLYYRHRLSHDWSGNVFDNMLHYGPMGNPSQAVIRRSAIQGATFATALIGSDDWDFFLQIASRGTLFGFIPKVFVYRGLSPNSFTGGMKGRINTKDATIRLYEKWMGVLDREKLDELGLGTVLNRILLKRAFLMVMDTRFAPKDIRETLRKILRNGPDMKTRFEARSFFIAVSILPLAFLRMIAAFIDRKRSNRNFIKVSVQG